MENDSLKEAKKNSRKEPRIENLEAGSVEFTPGSENIAYHFRLRDFSSKGMGILVRQDSMVLKQLSKGEVLTMKYHPEKATTTPLVHKTKIMHISEPEPGQYKNHILVGLLILEET